VADEPRMQGVPSQAVLLGCRVERDVPARQRHEDEALLGEQILELGGSVAPCIERRLPELDAVEAERGDVVDGLTVVAVPGDRRAAEPDARGGQQVATPYGRARERADACREKIAPLHHLRPPTHLSNPPKTCPSLSTSEKRTRVCEP